MTQRAQPFPFLSDVPEGTHATLGTKGFTFTLPPLHLIIHRNKKSIKNCKVEKDVPTFDDLEEVDGHTVAEPHVALVGHGPSKSIKIFLKCEYINLIF